jgi:hypothetical protein
MAIFVGENEWYQKPVRMTTSLATSRNQNSTKIEIKTKDVLKKLQLNFH